MHAGSIECWVKRWRVVSVELSAGGLIGPEFVADGDGAILRGAAPFTLATRLKGNGAVEKTDTRYARRRVGSIRVGSGLTVRRRRGVLIHPCLGII